MEKRNYRILFTQKQYRKLLLADLISRFGDSLDAIAYSFIMYEITGNEALMAFILGLNYIPTVILQPLSGAFVDRFSKKRLMVLTDVIRFFIVGLLVILYTTGRLTPLIITLLTLATSTVEAFRMPAGNAVLPLLLEPELYTLGKAASYSSARVSQLLGFIVSGGLIALIGSAGVLWIDAVTFALSALLISTLSLTEASQQTRVPVNRIFTDFRSGLRFLGKSRLLQMLSLIGLVINFGLMPLSLFQAPYVSDYLQMGAETLSYIKVLMMIGMMAGAAVTPRLLFFKRSRLCTAAGIDMGISLICMHITVLIDNPLFKAGLLTLSMLCVGIGGEILNVIVGGCMMTAVPKNMMGRMSGLNAAIMEASMPIGSFLCSALVLELTVTQLLSVFGCCTILLYLFLGLFHHLTILDTAG